MERFKNQKLSQILKWDMYAYCCCKTSKITQGKAGKVKTATCKFYQK